MKSRFLFLLSTLVAMMLSTNAVALADGEEGDDQNDGAEVNDSVNDTSPQALDKRLPPVLPGQEVTVNGDQMNVWSTAGQVGPQMNQPSNQGNLNQQLNGADVIVDQRPFGRGGVPRR